MSNTAENNVVLATSTFLQVPVVVVIIIIIIIIIEIFKVA